MEERARIPVGLPVSKPLASYWQSPKSPLANINHLGDSSQPYDHVIIGSGISGAMIAYNLLRACPNALILMLEARELCSGATGRNGGHTKAASYRSYLQHVEELGIDEALKIARLEFDNIVETHRLAQELLIDCESEMCKTVDIIYDEKTFEQGKKAVLALRPHAREEELRPGGMAWYNIHENVETVSTHFRVSATNENPAVEAKEKVVGAFEYMAGRINAYRFTTGVLAECVKRGLKICTNTPVHNIVSSNSHEEPTWKISTPRSTLTARNVILATNAYTPHLVPSLQSAIVPMRGQITAQRPGRAAKIQTPLPTTYSFIYSSGYEYMIPYPLSGPSHYIIGGGLGRLPSSGASEFGTVDDSVLNSDVSAYLHGSLVGYYGAANWGEVSRSEEGERVVCEWTGIMGATADGRPFVGRLPGSTGRAGGDGGLGRSLWVQAGFNGHGMVLCLKVAQALVEMIVSGSAKDLDWFPQSFLVSEERLGRCAFKGRRDLLPKE